MRLLTLQNSAIHNVKHVYKMSFPWIERKPFWFLLYFHKKGNIQIQTIETMEGVFVGFVVLVQTGNYVFIDYLAIAPFYRGSGLGSKVLTLLKEMYFDKCIFLEVESLDEYAQNKIQRIRRVKFYEKNGFVIQNKGVRIFYNDMRIMAYNGTVSFEDYCYILKKAHTKLYLMIVRPKCIL